jgi:hypothetical protein
MHDARLVSRVERAGGLAQPAQRSVVGDRPAGLQPVPDGAAAHQLHHHEHAALVLADVIDRDHVWVPGEARGGAGLAREPQPSALVLGQVGGEDLDRHRAPEQLVVSLPHARHPAVGDVAHDAVAVGQGDAGRADRWHS